MNDTANRSRYSIVPIGVATGWGLKIDGVLRRSNPRMLPLAAYVDAMLAGASEVEADLIAKALAARPWPTYEERLSVFQVTGPWRPSPDPFGKKA